MIVQAEPGVWIAYRALAGTRTPAHPADAAAAVKMAPARAREFLAGRALLRALLITVRPEAARLEVRAGINGKPALPQAPRIGISISHDGGHVAAAVASGRQIGVDLQMPPRKASDAMVRRCAARHTRQLFLLGPAARAREFAWIWSVQEACVKATGSGLAGRPWTVEVAPGSTTGQTGDIRWRALRRMTPYPLSYAWREM